MRSQQRSIPRAISRRELPVIEFTIPRALNWFVTQSRIVGGQPLLYVPMRDSFNSYPELVALSKRVQTETWATLGRSRWTGGAVLAAWPEDDRLAQIDADRRTRALCFLPWADDDGASWVAAFDPEELTPAVPRRAAETNQLDPVVVEGLKTLSILVNHANQLAGSMDKRDAINVLRTLHDSGHRLDPPAIYTWALAHGWPAGGAQRLRKYAEDFAAGKRPRSSNPQALRPGILETWRQTASEQA